MYFLYHTYTLKTYEKKRKLQIMSCQKLRCSSVVREVMGYFRNKQLIHDGLLSITCTNIIKDTLLNVYINYQSKSIKNYFL